MQDKKEQDSALGKDRILDLSRKRTELGWARVLQGSAERFTPLWFTWIEWLFLTGALAYIAERTGDLWVMGLAALSLLVLYFYFMQLCFSVRVEPWHTKWVECTSLRTRRIAAVLFAVAVTLIVYGMKTLLWHITAILAANPA
jgi:hypothetical protein